ncbi:rod shape-determining protein MreD [Geomonas sp. RF6]|nr:rod shape-determining protein MreD [Geomonas sp. RF6]UFS72873.1 rod shape-determining protein MreD [Geomonas sp. RF6]
MARYCMVTVAFTAALILQLTVLPAYLMDPFQPNFIIILVVYLGLKRPQRFSPPAAFTLGLLQDSFSGIYLGLHAFSYLCIYFLLAKLSDRLYTDNRFLLVLTVFLATVLSGLLCLLLLAAFSVSNGIYSSILPAIIPQALVNALVASLIFYLPHGAAEEETQ